MAFPLPRSAQPVECWIPPEDTYGVGVKGSREAGPMRVPVNTGPRLGGDNSVSQVKGPENDLIVYSQIKSNQTFSLQFFFLRKKKIKKHCFSQLMHACAYGTDIDAGTFLRGF